MPKKKTQRPSSQLDADFLFVEKTERKSPAQLEREIAEALSSTSSTSTEPQQLTGATITDDQIKEQILAHPQLVLRALLPKSHSYARRQAREALARILNRMEADKLGRRSSR